MKLVYIFYTIFILIKLALSGCHTGTLTSTNNKLGIRVTAGVSWAGSNSGLYANIYQSGTWRAWRNLDNTGCDDLKAGEVDYFNDFDSYGSAKWDAVALYICGPDGVLIEDVFYWNGASRAQTFMWKAGVFGPYPSKCLHTGGSKATEATGGSWSDILIDGDTEGCDGVVFGTGAHGTVWTSTLPGVPDCSGEYGNAVPVINKPNNYSPHTGEVATDFETKLLNYLMIVIGIALVLFVSNSCLITVMVKNGYRFNGSYGYNKVDKDDINV